MSSTLAPKPWRIKGNRVKSFDHGKEYTVADVKNPKFTDDCVASHAALISASPDLLAACEALLSSDFQSGKRDGATMGQVSIAIDLAREAIKKAKGEA